MTMKPYQHIIDAPRQASGITQVIPATIDLASVPVPEGAKPYCKRLMRAKHYTYAPKGIVPLHSHENRPTIFYILSGEMHEYNSEHKAVRVFKPGDFLAEFGDIPHWSTNPSETEDLVLVAFDLFDDGKPADEGC